MPGTTSSQFTLQQRALHTQRSTVARVNLSAYGTERQGSWFLGGGGHVAQPALRFMRNGMTPVRGRRLFPFPMIAYRDPCIRARATQGAEEI